MKISHIAQAEHIDTLRRRGYHMALAQYLGRYPSYLEMYKSFHKLGHFIIVDNGVAEGTPLEWRDVAALAAVIHADEVVMADVIKDGAKTIENARRIQTEGLVPPCKRMVVPQGRNWDEWEECLQTLTMCSDFASIGIPKHLESLKGGREKALSIIAEGDYAYFNIHLLGCYGNPLKEITTLKKFGFVRGIDTGAAVAYAQAGVLLSEYLDKDVPRHSLDWETKADPEIVLHNVTTLEAMTYGA